MTLSSTTIDPFATLPGHDASWLRGLIARGS